MVERELWVWWGAAGSGGLSPAPVSGEHRVGCEGMCVSCVRESESEGARDGCRHPVRRGEPSDVDTALCQVCRFTPGTFDGRLVLGRRGCSRPACVPAQKRTGHSCFILSFLACCLCCAVVASASRHGLVLALWRRCKHSPKGPLSTRRASAGVCRRARSAAGRAPALGVLLPRPKRSRPPVLAPAVGRWVRERAGALS